MPISKIYYQDHRPIYHEPKAKTGKFDEGDCAFCLVSPQVDKAFPPCGHTFCFVCLAKWCDIKKECPICKQEILFIDCNYGGKRYYTPLSNSTVAERISNWMVRNIQLTATLNSNSEAVSLPAENLQYRGQPIRSGISREELETTTKEIFKMKDKFNALLKREKLIWPFKSSKKRIRKLGNHIFMLEHYVMYGNYG